jgi:hypothetical protein
MRPLDLLELFDKGSSAFAFIATYEFDPQFFERRMLGRRTFASADRIIVFMDRGRYQELVNHGLPVSGFNRRYLVVPIDRAPQVFHPKLYVALGDKRADGLVGSNNCTTGGIAYNMELCSTFSVNADRTNDDDQTARHVIRQIYEAMKTYALDSPSLHKVIEEQFFQPAEERFPWLHRNTTIPSGEIELLLSHNAPLWPEVKRRLEPRTLRKITVIAPFYDRDLGLLKQLRKQWPDAALTIVAQQKYATLAGKKLAKLFVDGKKDRLLSATPKPGRRLHAKAFAFETEAGTYWLTGSPNATLAALDGKNSEAALWINSKERADALLENENLPLEDLDPSNFEAGTEQEPKNEESPNRDLTLVSVILGETGVLECAFETAHTIQSLTLRIRNYNEALAVLSIPMHGTSRGSALLELDENQIGQIRGAAVCEIKGTGKAGQDVLSNPVALIQLYHLLRERPAHGGSRNPLQAISESGENLVPYVDSLSSVREAVEFFDNCSIRFFDGEHGTHRHGQGMWKPRDPFKADTPVNWLNVPTGASTADLRRAIWEFVERHQWEKLYKHVRRGNLNGLPNFLDIFRTLNGLMLTYHSRTIAGDEPVIPHGYISTGIMLNLELLIGPFEVREDAFEGNGFISSILANVKGDKEIVQERLREERAPQMLRAAVEAMIDARMKARKLPNLDIWSMNRLRWVSDWIKMQGLETPSTEDIRAAGLEYMPTKLAA